MNTNKVSAIISLFLLSLTVSSPSVHADVGKLTIDGVEIPENLYDGFYKGKQWCPPTSDTRYRDRMINAALLVFAGREGDFELNTSEQERFAEAAGDLERAKSGSSDDAIARAAWKLFYLESTIYGSYLYQPPSELFTRQDVLNEYERLIEIKDPRLADVVIGRYLQFAFPDSEKAEKAIDMFNSGKSLIEVTSAIAEHKLFDHNKDNWFVIDEITGFTGDSHSLKTGMAVLASEGQSWYGSEEQFVLYLDEVRELPRLPLSTKYNNSSDYAYNVARYDLWGRVHDARRLERWKNADIQENGEPIVMLDQYPECP